MPEDTGALGELAVALCVHSIADGNKVLSSFEVRVMQPWAFTDAVTTFLFAVARQMLMTLSGMAKHPCTGSLLVRKIPWKEKPLFCALPD